MKKVEEETEILSEEKLRGILAEKQEKQHGRRIKWSEKIKDW